MVETVKCKACKGRGATDSGACRWCYGTGKATPEALDLWKRSHRTGPQPAHPAPGTAMATMAAWAVEHCAKVEILPDHCAPQDGGVGWCVHSDYEYHDDNEGNWCSWSKTATGASVEEAIARFLANEPSRTLHIMAANRTRREVV